MQISVVLILSIQDKEIKVCHLAKYITQMVLRIKHGGTIPGYQGRLVNINSRSFTAGLVSATESIIPSYKLNVNTLIFFF